MLRIDYVQGEKVIKRSVKKTPGFCFIILCLAQSLSWGSTFPGNPVFVSQPLGKQDFANFHPLKAGSEFTVLNNLALVHQPDLPKAVPDNLNVLEVGAPETLLDNLAFAGNQTGNALANRAHHYQNAGMHADALEMLGQALQINRVNNGLFHASQIPLVESRIKSLLALGEHGEVNQQLEYLVYLYQKLYGNESAEMIMPLATKIAWDMRDYESVNNSNSLSVTGLGLSGATPGLDEKVAAENLLAEIQRHIVQGIQILVGTRDFSNPFLYSFEKQLIETYFYQTHFSAEGRDARHHIITPERSYIAVKPFDLGKASFQNGKLAYERLLQYMSNSGKQESLQFAEAVIGLGDWYLLYDYYELAYQQYENAAALLEAGSFTEGEKRSLLYPALPVELPAFGEPGLDAAEQYSRNFIDSGQNGYVDVSFRISRYGKVMEIDVLDQSPQMPQVIISMLESKLKKSLFRPRLHDDSSDADDYRQVRYFYTY